MAIKHKVQPLHLNSYLSQSIAWEDIFLITFLLLTFFNQQHQSRAYLSIMVPLGGEGVSLFMVKVLLQIEKCVKKDWSHLTPLQVSEWNFIYYCRPNHVQHLKEVYTMLRQIECEKQIKLLTAVNMYTSTHVSMCWYTHNK